MQKSTPLLGVLIIQYEVILAPITALPRDRRKREVHLHTILNISVEEGN
jgi:hypothetical protein